MIRLADFLKLEGLVSTGGQAKFVIQDGHVEVNGEVETRRKKQLSAGDIVAFNGEERVVPAADDGDRDGDGDGDGDP